MYVAPWCYTWDGIVMGMDKVRPDNEDDSCYGAEDTSAQKLCLKCCEICYLLNTLESKLDNRRQHCVGLTLSKYMGLTIER